MLTERKASTIFRELQFDMWHWQKGQMVNTMSFSCNLIITIIRAIEYHNAVIYQENTTLITHKIYT